MRHRAGARRHAAITGGPEGVHRMTNLRPPALPRGRELPHPLRIRAEAGLRTREHPGAPGPTVRRFPDRVVQCLVTEVVLAYRCGAVPDSHRVPSCDATSQSSARREPSACPAYGGVIYGVLCLDLRTLHGRRCCANTPCSHGRTAGHLPRSSHPSGGPGHTARPGFAPSSRPAGHAACTYVCCRFALPCAHLPDHPPR